MPVLYTTFHSVLRLSVQYNVVVVLIDEEILDNKSSTIISNERTSSDSTVYTHLKYNHIYFPTVESLQQENMNK